MKLGAAARLVETRIDETLNHYAFPSQHWRSLRINDAVAQKSAGTAHVGDPTANARGGSVFRRQLCDASGCRAPAACGRNPMGQKRYLDMSHLKIHAMEERRMN
jgi:hypothetical protein